LELEEKDDPSMLVTLRQKGRDSYYVTTYNFKHCAYSILWCQKSIINFDNCNNDTLDLLGLNEFYTNKFQLQNALCIKSDIVRISVKGEGCPNLHDLPFFVLYKLMSYDVKCRSNLMFPVGKQTLPPSQQHDSIDDDVDYYNDSDDDDNENVHKSVSEVEKAKHQNRDDKINPMDCLHALLLCCENILRQDLFTRLAKCQLSIPFLMPDPIKNTIILPIWAMRSIIKEWTPRGKEQQSHCVVTYPIVSFIKIWTTQKPRNF